MEVDWDKGIPPDVIALVAKAGGATEMKIMRGISKSWKVGYELGVACITVGLQHPMLTVGLEAAQRFPGLTRLDLGMSLNTDVAWLENLGAFLKLDSLVLGGQPLVEGMLALRVTDADLSHLRVCSLFFEMCTIRESKQEELKAYL